MWCAVAGWQVVERSCSVLFGHGSSGCDCRVGRVPDYGRRSHSARKKARRFLGPSFRNGFLNVQLS